MAGLPRLGGAMDVNEALKIMGRVMPGVKLSPAPTVSGFPLSGRCGCLEVQVWADHCRILVEPWLYYRKMKWTDEPESAARKWLDELLEVSESIAQLGVPHG